MVPDRQAHQEDDEQDEVPVLALRQVVGPVEDEEGHQRDRHERDRVHLGLGGIHPVGEAPGRQAHRAEGGDVDHRPGQLPTPVAVDSADDLRQDEEVAERTDGRRQGAHQVGLGRESDAQRQHAEYVPEQDEERRAGGVRDAQAVGGGHELARVPESQRGRHRRHVGNEHNQERQAGEKQPVAAKRPHGSDLLRMCLGKRAEAPSMPDRTAKLGSDYGRGKRAPRRRRASCRRPGLRQRLEPAGQLLR